LGIKVRHCRTLKMLADFFTKPLQGALFRKFRDVILGLVDLSELEREPDSNLDLPVEERVGEGRQIGRGTDHKQFVDHKQVVDADGFILVQGKEKRKKNHVDGYVAEARNRKQRNTCKIVSWSLP
jgi:hypothetical protein